MLVTQTSLRLLSGLVVFPRWQYRLRFSNAERIHAGNASLAFGFAVASQRLHAVIFGFATASQWYCSVFMLVTQTSLRLCSGFVESSR